MGTSTPVFPNGRVGTTISSELLIEELLCVWAKVLNGAIRDPNPPAQAVLIKSLLEKSSFLPDMLFFSLGGKITLRAFTLLQNRSSKGSKSLLL
jgi:hypothetical protein